MMTCRAAIGAWAAGCLLALPALAADPFTDAMHAAYAPYRAALFRTNGKSQAEAGQATTQAQRLVDAHETLEQARDLMAELRKRNDMVVFSDHMNAYRAEMEHVLNDGAKAGAAAPDSIPLRARVGALDYLVGRLRSDAASALMREPEFVKHLQAVARG